MPPKVRDTDLICALVEVRDELFPFVSYATIERIVLAHASDQDTPSMATLVREMVDASLG